MEHTSWASCAAGNLAARQAILQENLSLVHFVAKQLSRNLSADADPDEMVNIGALGLMAAVESFDESRGLAFSTYAVPRIRGAILDELRRQDHVPRSIRRKTREVSQARESIMSANGRAPTDEEVAGRLGIDVPTLWRWQADMERAIHVSLDSSQGEHEETARSPIHYLRAVGEDAHERLQREEEVAALREAILSLKEQQRVVLSLYYFEELNARQIAEVLGISESRVSQIRSKALTVLREQLRVLADIG